MSETWDLYTSVQKVVDSIQAEIDMLVQQNSDLNRYKRNLWRQLQAFQSGTTSSRGDLTCSSIEQRKAAGRAAARKSRYLYEKLWRACRIAILEAGDATAEQIYSQIVRRGSFNFDDLKENPISAIARTLNVMSRPVGVL